MSDGAAATPERPRQVGGIEPVGDGALAVPLGDAAGQVAAVRLGVLLERDQVVGERPRAGLEVEVGGTQGVHRRSSGGTID
ncbi:MAG: hypothetical protein U0R78_05270 [Nocardioidaceae bacterium]